VVWEDEKGGVYGQVLDTAGNRRWTQETLLSPAGAAAFNPTVAAFADGSFLLTYSVKRANSTNLWDVYARRIDAAGTGLWGQALRVNAADYLMYEPDLRNRPQGVVDALGYLVVAWRGDDGAGDNIFLRRFAPDGTPDWPADLRADLTPYEIPGHFENTILSVAAGGAIYVAAAARQNDTHGIAVKKFSLNGLPEWAAATWTAQLPTYDFFVGNPNISIVPDGGAVIAWDDEQNTRNIYLQKIDPAGAALWPRAPLHNNITWPLHPALTPLMSGGFLLAWHDDRKGDNSIYFQKVGVDGSKLWALDHLLIPFEMFYRPRGSVVSRAVGSTSEVIPRATLTVTQTLNGGAVRYYLSNTGGQTWEEVIPGIRHEFVFGGSDLRWRADFFASGDSSKTPLLSALKIRYVDNTAGDNYEPDDFCGEAQPIGMDGALQLHTFYQHGDADWVSFIPTPDTTYVIQTSATQAKADTILDLYTNCQSAPVQHSDNTLGQDARLEYRSPDALPVYIRVSNVDPNQFGAQTGYDLSVRASSSVPLVIIVAGQNGRNELWSNIQYSADAVYLIFLNKGIPKERIRYLSHNNHDVDGNKLNDDIQPLTGPVDVRSALENWAPAMGLAPGVPLYLYLVDHGILDAFKVNGDFLENQVRAADLNLWLTNLENRTGADQVSVIIEACRSGSFISRDALEPGSLSGQNRVIITAANVARDAHPSRRGTVFSDKFWSEVSENKNLEVAFRQAVLSVEILWKEQDPWLDDNGDGHSTGLDGSLARSRGLTGFSGSAPAILQAGVLLNGSGQAVINAYIRADTAVQSAWAIVVPPGYLPPPPSPDGSLPPLDLPVIALEPAGGDWYTAAYSLPAAPGNYQFVVYATDDQNLQAMPASVTICAGCRSYFLPVLSRP